MKTTHLGSNYIQFNPAKVLALSFIGIIIIGSVLLALPISTKDLAGIPYIDALFTATSAICVTGLVVVDTADAFSIFGQVVIMVLIQIGGLGLMTFAILVAMVLGLRISFTQRLILQETFSRNSVQGVVNLLKHVLVITFIMELLGTLLLAFHWYPEMGQKAFYYGLFHTISAFNNAGFDLFGNSLAGFKTDFMTNSIIMVLFIFGGLGFFVISDLYTQRSLKKISYHSKLAIIFSGVLIITGFLIIFLLEYNNPDTLGALSIGEKVMVALFTSTTTRTAGFSTLDIAALNQASLLLILLLMFIGASPGSTGGGVKTTTFGVIVSSTLAGISNKKQSILFHRAISNEIIVKSQTIIFLSVFLIFLATFIMSIYESNPFMEILFEVVSAFGTVGLSTGLTPELSLQGKLVIIFTMYTGRIGPLALFYVLSRNSKELVKYPTGNIMIG
ncbi:MAG: ATP synthase subunit J [Desulfitibacter sp. BRH_c19]|nr:MAG: ATP synthase subunit J [Desulfitibacter sp. BRH_c19]